MRNIERGTAALVSVVLISVAAIEGMASPKTTWPRGASAIVQNGGQPHTQRRSVGVQSGGRTLQDKMQHENQSKEPTSVETPNLRGARRSGELSKRRRGTSGIVDLDLNQPAMAATSNEVAVEGRQRSPTSTRRRSSVTPEVGDEVLLRERGLPHKQPPTRRGPHRM